MTETKYNCTFDKDGELHNDSRNDNGDLLPAKIYADGEKALYKYGVKLNPENNVIKCATYLRHGYCELHSNMSNN